MKNAFEESPTELKIKADMPLIKRLNNKPKIITITIITSIVLALMYAINKSDGIDKNETDQNVTITSTNPDHTIDDLYNKSLLGDKNDTNGSINLFEQNGTNSLSASQVNQLSPEEEELRKQLAIKMKMANDALYSPTRLDNSQGNTQNPISNVVGDVADVISGLANAAGATTSSTQKDAKDPNEQFVENSKKSYDYLPYTKTPQLSPYELKTGSVIPGVLLTGINSQLPGNIVGQVSENVYDSATGKHLLIPQGSKLVGTYNPDVKYGQNRAMIAWNRIVYPNGDTLNLEAMIGSDQAGYSGFDDKVDNHYFRIFGSALLISVISGELSFSNNKITINQNPSSQGTTVSQTGNTLLEKNLEVDPTIEIRPGYRFNIFVTKDISFKK